MKKRGSCLFACFTLFIITLVNSVSAQTTDSNYSGLIERAINNLLQMQEADGAWPYEGVYRVGGEIPVGYRGWRYGESFAIHCYQFPKKHKGCGRGNTAGHPANAGRVEGSSHGAEYRNAYDVRVWGHIYALDLFCRLPEYQRFEDLREKTDPWIEKLTATLIEEEINGGGWNYANHKNHAAFVTAPAVQALLLARKSGQEIPLKFLNVQQKFCWKVEMKTARFNTAARSTAGVKLNCPAQLLEAPFAR